MDWKITLSEPSIDNEELQSVVNVINSKWFTMGDITRDFEQQFAEKIGCKYAFAVTNGTAALHIANMALDIRTGDEVICPALTFVATANASRYTGAEVIFADSISAEDLTIDPEDISNKITLKTKAITVVHYSGFPCQMQEILKIAKKHHLNIIEDCAHAPLSKWRDKNGDIKFVGTIGHIGCFSFFSNKNMTTAEGGMLITNDDNLAEKIRLLRSHGMTSLTLDRHRGHSSGYDVIELGYNYRIDEIRSAIGITQLKKLEPNNIKRRQLFSHYLEQLKNNDNIIVPFHNRELDLCTPHIMAIIIKNHYQKIKHLLFEHRIQTSKHYDLIPKFTLYKNPDFKSKIEFIDNILTLPMYPELSLEDVRFICNLINSVK